MSPLFVVRMRFPSHILQSAIISCCIWHPDILWLLIANSSVSLASPCSCSQPLLGCCISPFRSIPFQSVQSTADSVIPLRRLHVCYILRRIFLLLSTPAFVTCSLSMCGQLLSSLPLRHTQPQSLQSFPQLFPSPIALPWLAFRPNCQSSPTVFLNRLSPIALVVENLRSL